MIIKRRPANIADSAYMTRDGRGTVEYFHSRRAAYTWARDHSRLTDIVVHQRIGMDWESLCLFRGGKVFRFGNFTPII